MLIKLLSLAIVIISAGVISRGVYKLFRKRKKTLFSAILINFVSSIIIFALGILILDYFSVEEQLKRSFLLSISSLSIWITIDLITLESSSNYTKKILGKDISILTSIIITTFFISLVSLIYYPTDQQLAARNLQEEVGDVMKGLAGEDVVLGFEKPLSEKPRMEGEKGEIEQFIREIVNIGIDNRNKYRAEIFESNVHTILDPPRLRGALNKVHTEQLLEKGLEIIDRYVSKQDVVYENILSKVKNLNMDQRKKELFIYDFNKSLSASKENSNLIWKLEREVFIQSAKLANWLGENNDSWLFDNNQFQFYSDQDLVTFNEIYERLNNTLSEQQAIIQASSAKMERGLKSL